MNTIRHRIGELFARFFTQTTSFNSESLHQVMVARTILEEALGYLVVFTSIKINCTEENDGEGSFRRVRIDTSLKYGYETGFPGLQQTSASVTLFMRPSEEGPPWITYDFQMKISGVRGHEKSERFKTQTLRKIRSAEKYFWLLPK